MMSTAGSSSNGPDEGASVAGSRQPLGTYTPGAAAKGEVEKPPARKRTRIIRWNGLIPLAVVIVLLAIGYTLFADRVAKTVIAEAATGLLGT